MAEIEQDTGWLLSVDDEDLGSALTVDVTADAITLQLDDAEAFAEDGGILEIGGYKLIYTGANLDTDVLTLDENLGANTDGQGFDEGESVWACDPVSQERLTEVVADVEFTNDPEGDNDPVRCVVAQALSAFLPRGAREGRGETVTLQRNSVGSEWSLVEVAGARASLDLTGGTLPVVFPPAEVPDPVAPGSSPAIKQVSGTPTGLIVVTENVDPGNNIEYHIREATDPSTPFLPTAGDPSTLAIETTSPIAMLNALASGAALAAGQTYQVAVFASNTAGAAPAASPSVDGQLDLEAVDALIAAAIDAVRILTGSIQIGSNITISAPTADPPNAGGILIETVAGNIVFPANGDPAQIAAHLTAKSLTVEGGAQLYGVNLMAGQLTLTAVLPDPTTTPTLAATIPTINVATARSQARGITWLEGNIGLVAASDPPVGSVMNGAEIRTIDMTTGALVGASGGLLLTLPFNTAVTAMTKPVGIDVLYVMTLNVSTLEYRLERRTLTRTAGVVTGISAVTNTITVSSPAGDVYGGRAPGLALLPAAVFGTPSDRVMTGWVDKTTYRLKYRLYDPTTLAPTGVAGDLASGSFLAARDIGALWWGDSGAGDRLHLGCTDYGNVYAWSVSGGAFVRDEAQDFERPVTPLAGLTWHPAAAALVAQGRARTLHPLSSFTTSQTYRVRYAWHDSVGTARTSLASPLTAAAAILVPARKWLSVTTPAPPEALATGEDKANRVKIYVGVGAASTPTLRTTLPVGGPWKVDYRTLPGAGAGVETVSGFAAVSQLGTIQSELEVSAGVPRWQFKGDGSGRLAAGKLAWAADGTLTPTGAFTDPIPWTNLVLQTANGYTAVSGQPIQYKRDAAGGVHLRGAVNRATAVSNAHVTTIPIDCVPVGNFWYWFGRTNATGGAANLRVELDGRVFIQWAGTPTAFGIETVFSSLA